MRKTFKYRIYPTKSQETLMDEILEECRWLYNQTLEYQRNLWQTSGKSVGLYDLNKELTRWKVDRPALKKVHSQVLQNVQERVDLAFKAFFRRVKAGEKPGFPRFKGQGRYRSFTYKQFGFKLTDEGQLGLSKMGDVKMVMHRPIQGQIKTLTICRYATGKWYACFSVEVEPEPLPATDQVVGIDVGLEQFATFSNGEVIDNPRFLRQEEKALAKTQRRLSQLEKGSPEYLKQKKRLSRIHERIQFQRDDFAHQHSRRIVEAFQVIAFEDLDIQAMLENASNGLAKSIADAAWRQLVQDTCYKAESAGRTVILVDPRGTSQRCSGCGSVVEKSLSERTHHCHTCGLMLDRDLNAARNILALGLQGIGSNP